MCVYVGECFQSTALISDSVSEAKVAPEQLQKDYRDNQVQRRSAAHTANQFYQVVLFPPQTANFYYFFFLTPSQFSSYLYKVFGVTHLGVSSEVFQMP